jgi:ribosomal protein L40E
VREFNAIQAAGIAAALGLPMPAWGQPINGTVNMPPAEQAGQANTLIACGRCNQTNPPSARFCSGCGAAL